MTKEEQLIHDIHTITEEVGLPYFEVRAFKGYENIFTHIDKPADCADKDKVYLYSCTKPITVVCALQLVEAGKLSLDDCVSKYIPAFENAFVLDEGGNKQPIDKPITLRHLLTMSAGLDYQNSIARTLEFCEQQDNPSTEEIINEIARYPLNFMPGTQFYYSFCLDVLARVVEVASGMLFSDYAEQHVFKPLGMTSCGFRDNDQKRMLPQYTVSGDSIVLAHQYNAMVPSDKFDSGGAGLIGTAADYAKLGVALANDGLAENGYRLLRPESVLKMRTPQIDFLSVENSFTCVQGSDYSYGFGVRTRTVPTDFGLGVGEFGWDGAAGTYLMVDPIKNISIVMGMHVLVWPNVFKDKHLEIVKKVYETFDF